MRRHDVVVVCRDVDRSSSRNDGGIMEGDCVVKRFFGNSNSTKKTSAGYAHVMFLTIYSYLQD